MCFVKISVCSTKIDSFSQLKSEQTALSGMLCEKLPFWCPGLISVIQRPFHDQRTQRELFPNVLLYSDAGLVGFCFKSLHNFSSKYVLLIFFPPKILIYLTDGHHLMYGLSASICRSGAILAHGQGKKTEQTRIANGLFIP